MYQQHFGFSEQPFSISPDPNFLYMSERHREALAHLVYGASENGGFVMLTGQVGTGKTTLIRSLLQQSIHDVDFALCLYSGFSEIEFLSLILDELGATYPDGCENRKALVYALNEHALKVHASGRKIVIIIDEAQNLSRDLLEQIRLLTNLETNTQKLLRIILVGQEELQTLLAENSLRQLSQRITTRYHLTALNPSEVDEYIAYRLRVAGGSPSIIPASVRRRVCQLSKGTPRLINVICERALLGAYADNRDRLTIRDVELASERVLPTQPHVVKEDKIYPNRWHWQYFAISLFLTAGLVGFLRTSTCKKLLQNVFQPVATLPSVTTTSSQTDNIEAQRQKALADLQANQTTSVGDVESKPDTTPTGVTQVALAQTTSAVTPDQEESEKSAPQAETTQAESADSIAPETAVDTEQLAVTTSSDEKASDDEEAHATVTDASIADALTVNDDQQESSPTNRMDDIFKSPTSRAILAQNLAQLWGKSGSLSLDKSFCNAMQMERLTCVERQTSLRLISKLNRPALLELINPNTDDSYWVLLTALHDGTVRVSSLTDEFNVPFDAVAGDFTGKVLLLLRSPNTQFVVKPGEKSKQVAWLRERLQIYRNEPVEVLKRGVIYSQQIQNQVKNFQRDYGLTADGIVGDETLLYLYNLVGDASTPTLTEE